MMPISVSAEALLAASPDALIVADISGRIVLTNVGARTLLGYSEAEFNGLSVDDLLPERLRAVHSAHRASFAEKPTARPMGTGIGLSARARDGREIPVEISLSPLHTAEGLWVLAALRDVTAKKRSEEALRDAMLEAEAANRELEAFSYSVAHDLRSPLRSIDGFSQALLEDYGAQLDDGGRDMLGRVRGAAKRMGQLIDDLLGLSRVSRAEVRRETVDMTALAEDVAERLRQTHPGRDIQLSIAPQLAAQGDPRLLRIVFENLLGNAWKFTSKRGTAQIEVGKGKEDSPAAFFVRDNGAGFDMTYASKLFGAFQRLHKQTEFEGTGIGLATVQRVVRRHGGTVWAEGAIDVGAVFYFTLP